MSLEQALFRYVTEHASVGPLLRAQFYPEVARTAKDPSYPYATYSQSGEQPVWHLTAMAGLTNARVLIDLWCESMPQRATLAGAMQQALDTWAGTQREGVAIRLAQVVDQIDAYVPFEDGSEGGVYQRSLDVNIWYRDT